MSKEARNAKVDEIHALYEERNKLAAVYYRLSPADLRAVNEILPKLTDEELRLVLDFAEGLASFR